MGPNPVTGVLAQRENLDTEADIQKAPERMPCECEVRDGSDASVETGSAGECR